MMFTAKGTKMTDLDMNILFMRAMVEFASLINNPKGLKDATAQLVDTIRLSGEEKSHRQEYYALLEKTNARVDEMLAMEESLGAREERHKADVLICLEEVKAKLANIEALKAGVHKKAEEVKELERKVEGRLKAAADKENALDRKESLLGDREKKLAEREQEVIARERKIRAAHAVLD